MNTDLMIQIVGVLLILFFCFATFMCSKTWKISHVLFSFFTFAAAITFVIFLALVMRTHDAWRSIAEDLEIRVVEERAKGELLLNGDPNAVNPPPESCLRTLRQAYNQIMLDRGRVWRNCTIAAGNVSGQSGSLTFNLPASQPIAPVPADPNAPAPDPADPAAPPVAPTPTPPVVANVGLEINSLVYVFQETQKDIAGVQVGIPTVYLGEFRVASVNGNAVQVNPTMPIFPTNNFTGTWTLHETMPIDNHEMFVNMDDAQLQELLATHATEVISEYVRDHDKAKPTDNPENVWYQVEFVRPMEDYGVDSDSVYTELAGDYFDATGRAVEERLRRGEAASFPAGTKGLFDQETAKNMIANGFCDETTVEHIFVRPLRDYLLYFRELHDRTVVTRRYDAETKLDVGVIVLDNASGDEFKQVKSAEKDALTEDLARFQAELDEVSTFRKALEAKFSGLRDRLSRLYAETHYAERRLDEINRELTNQKEQQPTPAPSATASTN